MAIAYGEWLRRRREAAGMTQEDLAREAMMTRTHIAHIEAGRRWPSPDDARRLDKALGTGDVLVSFLPSTEGRPVGSHFEHARQFEQQAVIIREFALSCVPGILQTEAYARAALSAGFPPLSEDERDSAVVTRLERSQVLMDPVTPVVWALLDEAVLKRPVGGHGVMAEQLRYLVALVTRERIRVHVMPFRLGAHPLLDSMATLMSFDDQPPVAYVEGLYTGKVHDSPAMVERFRGMYDLALSDALPLKESLDLLRATAKEFERYEH